MSKSSLSVWVFSLYSFTKAPSYFWVLSVDLRNVFCQLCPRFKTRWIIQFSFSIFAIIYHRDTRKHWQLPASQSEWALITWCHMSMSGLASSLDNLNLPECPDDTIYASKSWTTLCRNIFMLEWSFHDKNVSNALRRWGERGAISKNYRESNKRPVPNSSDDFLFLCWESFRKDDKQKSEKNVPVFKNDFLHFAFLHFNL